MKLADKTCSDGGSVPRVKALRARELLKQLGRSWRLNGTGQLERFYPFKDFAQALAVATLIKRLSASRGRELCGVVTLSP
jgi:pterin-4a-carbinolamine dehydratase